jgi:hypothetical protein
VSPNTDRPLPSRFAVDHVSGLFRNASAKYAHSPGTPTLREGDPFALALTASQRGDLFHKLMRKCADKKAGGKVNQSEREALLAEFADGRTDLVFDLSEAGLPATY